MTAAMVLKSPMMLDDDYRRDLMIQYALTAYQYIMTVKEADEIFLEPSWKDVDNFCTYMQEVNFGDSIPGTTNLVLPSTMRIYTDEELDLMNAGTFIENGDILVGEFGSDEPLTLYPDPPPAYSRLDGPTASEVVEPTPIVTEFEVDGNVSLLAEAKNDPKEVEQVFFCTLGARLDRKLSEAKRKLVQGFKSCSPKRVTNRVRELHKRLFESKARM